MKNHIYDLSDFIATDDDIKAIELVDTFINGNRKDFLEGVIHKPSLKKNIIELMEQYESKEKLKILEYYFLMKD